MGKFKFTLVNLWFWAAMVFAIFLTENLMHLTAAPKAGFDYPTLILISVATLLCLFMFFFINHKQNKMKIDWVLLPGITIVGIVLLLGIWFSKDASYAFRNGEGAVDVVITNDDKIKSTIILFVFLVFSYGLLFAVNINSPHAFRRWKVLAYIGIGAALVSLLYSLISESNVYIAVLRGIYLPNMSIKSFFGNKNYYGGVLLIGFLSCIIAIYFKPRFFLFILMIVFTLALLASGSVLPTIIAAGALVIFLLEETIRFSFKKKWLYSFYSSFSLVLILFFIGLYYFGVSHNWGGFVHLNNYLTALMKSKDFGDLNDRTLKWSFILPHCFDSNITLLFGHGFMVSEKHILGITAAIVNDPTMGVRTTHNGYIQILFEYGILGAIAHLFLVAYFIYSAIRLLLEKKFHFIFIFLFVGLCAGIYNVCESSSYFDAGVKEMFMTALFAMPIISEAKHLKQSKKINEIKEIETNKESISHKVLGSAIATIFMALLVAASGAFVSDITYRHLFLKYILLNGLIGGGIALLFIPYLVSLYYKNSDKPYFVLHLVFNFVLIGFAIGLSYYFMSKMESLKPYRPYVIPVLLFLILLIETVVYSLIKNGSGKEWFDITIKGSFINNRYALIGGILFGFITYLAFEYLGLINNFSYLVIPACSLIGYFGVLHFFPTKSGREIIDEINECNISYIKNEVNHGETYYG